jgi:hypothetical protein
MQGELRGPSLNRRRKRLLVTAAALLLVAAALVIRNQVKVHRGREARAALMRQRHPAEPVPPAVAEQRRALFALLQPVALANCVLERFGEANDGGYLMCGNLLGEVQTAYSYGISGYDGWGCEISRKHDVPVHQYDCFNTTQPMCLFGEPVFHAECVGDAAETIDGRAFDTVTNQLARNGDQSKRIVLKIDVEGAEWASLLSTPDDTLRRVDQLAIEFHWAENETFDWVHDERYLRVVTRLREHFEVAHLHYNNTSCIDDLQPFPSHAFEALFVSKRLAIVAPERRATIPHPLDAPNNPSFAECVVQPADRVR